MQRIKYLKFFVTIGDSLICRVVIEPKILSQPKKFYFLHSQNLYRNQLIYVLFYLKLGLPKPFFSSLLCKKKRDNFFMSAQLNQHLGKKLRLKRTSLGLTQTQVAQAINVTFQQIQKYEKGTNGVSSARLLQLANFLKVPVKYFFEDYQDFSGRS